MQPGRVPLDYYHLRLPFRSNVNILIIESGGSREENALDASGDSTSADHLEAGRERFETRPAVADIEVPAVEIVYQQTTVSDALVLAGYGVFEIELGEP